MNRTNIVAADAANGYGIAVFAVVAVFFGDTSQDLGATIGFGFMTILAILTVTHVLSD